MIISNFSQLLLSLLTVYAQLAVLFFIYSLYLLITEYLIHEFQVQVSVLVWLHSPLFLQLQVKYLQSMENWFFHYHQQRNCICCKFSPTLGDGLMLHETCHATCQASDSLPASSVFFLLAFGVRKIHWEGPALFLLPTPFGNPGSL